MYLESFSIFMKSNQAASHSRHFHSNMATDLDRCFGPAHSLSSLFQSTAGNQRSDICQGELWSVPEYMSAAECQAIIQHTEALSYEDAPVSTGSGPVMMKDYRNNLRVMVQDQASADVLFQRITPFVPMVIDGMVAVGLNERFRYYKYEPGMYFQQHYDGAFYRNRSEFSLITLIVNLNQGYSGGETAFYDRRLPGGTYLNVAQAGKALLFKHRGWLHEGKLLEAGVKYMLRSDVMYRLPELTDVPTWTGKYCGLCKTETQAQTKKCGHAAVTCGCDRRSSYCPYCR